MWETTPADDLNHTLCGTHTRHARIRTTSLRGRWRQGLDALRNACGARSMRWHATVELEECDRTPCRMTASCARQQRTSRATRKDGWMDGCVGGELTAATRQRVTHVGAGLVRVRTTKKGRGGAIGKAWLRRCPSVEQAHPCSAREAVALCLPAVSSAALLRYPSVPRH